MPQGDRGEIAFTQCCVAPGVRAPRLADERSAMTGNVDTVFTPAAQRAQAERGSAAARQKAEGFPDRGAPVLAAPMADQDTALVGTATAAGAPYIQHRGGPKGF